MYYGVKSLFLIDVMGRVKNKSGQYYDNKHVMYEERVVILKARSHKEALRKAEKKAKAYEDKYPNYFGQVVRYKFLGCLDSFELFDNPADGVEVYSTTILCKKNVKSKTVIDFHFGLDLKDENKIRYKYRNAQLGISKKEQQIIASLRRSKK